MVLVRLMIGNTAAASMFTVANNLVVGSGSGSEGMTIYSDSTNDGYICFADGLSDPAYRMGQIIYSHLSNKLQFRTNGNTDELTIDNAGNTKDLRCMLQHHLFQQKVRQVMIL